MFSLSAVEGSFQIPCPFKAALCLGSLLLHHHLATSRTRTSSHSHTSVISSIPSVWLISFPFTEPKCRANQRETHSLWQLPAAIAAIVHGFHSTFMPNAHVFSSCRCCSCCKCAYSTPVLCLQHCYHAEASFMHPPRKPRLIIPSRLRVSARSCFVPGDGLLSLGQFSWDP